MSDHAPLAPSAAHRWARCPGSVRMTKDIESTPSRAALRGTAMHQVLEACLKKGKHPSVFLDNVFTIEGEDVAFDEDMVEWTTEALEWVQTYKRENKGCHLISEAKLETGKALSEDLAEDIWGTADVLIYSRKELVVFDLKGGYVDVEITDNYQLILYAIGAVAHFEDAMEIPAITNIKLVIHQPRSGGAKTLDVPREMLDQWGKFLEKAARETKLKNAPLRSSEEACKWCPAIGSCPVAAERATELAKNTNWPEVAVTISEQQLVDLLGRIDFIRKFLSAAETYATSRLLNGYQIPGFKLVAGNKHRKWRDDKIAESTLKELAKGGEIFTVKLLSPAQAEKRFPGQKEKIQELAFKPEGEPELALADDPRPTIPFRELKVIDGGS